MTLSYLSYFEMEVYGGEHASDPTYCNYITSVQPRPHPWVSSIQISGKRFAALDSLDNLHILDCLEGPKDKVALSDVGPGVPQHDESGVAYACTKTLAQVGTDLVAVVNTFIAPGDISSIAVETFVYDVSGTIPVLAQHHVHDHLVSVNDYAETFIDYGPFDYDGSVASCYFTVNGLSGLMGMTRYQKLTVAWNGVDSLDVSIDFISLTALEPEYIGRPVNNSPIDGDGFVYGMRGYLDQPFHDTGHFKDVAWVGHEPTSAFRTDTGLYLVDSTGFPDMLERAALFGSFQEYVYVDPDSDRLRLLGTGDAVLWTAPNDGLDMSGVVQVDDASLVSHTPWSGGCIIHFGGIYWMPPAPSEDPTYFHFHAFFEYTSSTPLVLPEVLTAHTDPKVAARLRMELRVDGGGP